MSKKRPMRKEGRKARLDEPRPVCPECGMVVNATTAASINKAFSTHQTWILIGVYCDSDCLLDAWERGWPQDRVELNGFKEPLK